MKGAARLLDGFGGEKEGAPVDTPSCVKHLGLGSTYNEEYLGENYSKSNFVALSAGRMFSRSMPRFALLGSWQVCTARLMECILTLSVDEKAVRVR